jgi:hypothetical protein
MASPAVHLHKYHKVHAKQGGFECCDHDQSVYHYRMIEGQMVLKGIALKRGWEGKHYDATKLSCYKAKGDDTLARYPKKESPDDLATVWEQSPKSINSIADHYCTSWNTARRWLRDEGYIDPAGIDLTSPRPAPLGVEVPDYEDDGDLEASPYIIKPDPLIAQLGVAIDIIHAERKARTLALIAPIAANADALAMIRDLFDKGLL